MSAGFSTSPQRLLPGFTGPVPSAALDKCYFVRTSIEDNPRKVKGNVPNLDKSRLYLCTRTKSAQRTPNYLSCPLQLMPRQLLIVLVERAKAVAIISLPRFRLPAEMEDRCVRHHPVHINLTPRGHKIAVIIPRVVIPAHIRKRQHTIAKEGIQHVLIR